jgi:hypothetical protein
MRLDIDSVHVVPSEGYSAVQFVCLCAQATKHIGSVHIRLSGVYRIPVKGFVWRQRGKKVLLLFKINLWEESEEE